MWFGVLYLQDFLLQVTHCQSWCLLSLLLVANNAQCWIFVILELTVVMPQRGELENNSDILGKGDKFASETPKRILSGGTSKCVAKVEIVKSSAKLGGRKKYPQQRGGENRFMVHKKSLQWGNRFVCLLWSAGLETKDKILAGIRSWAQQVIITASRNDFGQEGETHRQNGSSREDKSGGKKK